MSKSAREAVTLGPDDPPRVPADASERSLPSGGHWAGPTYYGRPQLKSAPFENGVVGSYIFLAGLSGSAMALSTVADMTRGRQAEGLVRRGRYLAMLAPVLGAPLLIYDLHTPKRFYNMLRIAKPTSPMSIGTWILMGFSGAAGATFLAQAGSDLWPRLKGLRSLARVTQVPAAMAGLGLSTYTASLLSATSTPLWAAAPRSLALRFASSSIVSASSALMLLEPDRPTRRALEGVAATALAAELAGTAISHGIYERSGVAETLDSPEGMVERIGVTGLGTVLPLGVLAASALTKRGLPLPAVGLAALAAIAGAAALRITVMALGDRSAERPDISFRFSQPRNLPRRYRPRRRAAAAARAGVASPLKEPIMTQQIPVGPDAKAHAPKGEDGLHEITPDLAYRRLGIVNVVFVGPPGAGDRGWVLVDAGIPGTKGLVESAAETRFGKGARPAAIVLTHAHFDHVGALNDIAKEWDAPVYAHEQERPYLDGSAAYPPGDPKVGGGAMALLSPLYPTKPVDVSSRLKTLPADGRVPPMPGWRWLHTPGHSPGHVSFWRENDRSLIVGDAFITVAGESAYATAVQAPEIHGPPKYYTIDWDAARRSVETLAQLAPERVITGHGRPLHGPDMRRALETLAQEFDRVAVPEYGRYVDAPARAEDGSAYRAP